MVKSDGVYTSYHLTEGLFLASQLPEEVAEDFGAFFFHYTAGKFYPMVEAPVNGKVIERTGSPGFGVETSENHAINPCEQYGAHTHRAGLKGYIQRRPTESPGIQLS